MRTSFTPHSFHYGLCGSHHDYRVRALQLIYVHLYPLACNSISFSFRHGHSIYFLPLATFAVCTIVVWTAIYSYTLLCLLGRVCGTFFGNYLFFLQVFNLDWKFHARSKPSSSFVFFFWQVGRGNIRKTTTFELFLSYDKVKIISVFPNIRTFQALFDSQLLRSGWS